MDMHIGIILDGNRRFAKSLGKNPWDGHKEGAKRVEELIQWALDLKVKELTLYTLSVDNFTKRTKKEIFFLLKLFKEMFSKIEKDSKLHENKVRINYIGRLHMFDEELQNNMKSLMKKTENYDKLKVNFAVAYGGREEVIDAVKNIIKQSVDLETLNKKTFGRYLYLESEPDLIIRTGGNHRTSNFLIWQSFYSEWLFLDKFWPEFSKQDLINAIDYFNNQERRFGK